MKVACVVGIASVFAGLGCGANDEPIETRKSKVVGAAIREVLLPEPVLSGCPQDDVPLGTGAAHVAISVAVVPAGSLGTLTDSGPLPADKVLLATSCRTQEANGGNVIYFIDPGGPTLGTLPETVTGTLAHRITTTVSSGSFPAFGWGALAFRGDFSPQDMIACANPASGADPHKIYSINLLTGVASELFEAAADPTLPFPCDGLAWDAASDTIWMSPDISPRIYHYANPVPATPGVAGTQLLGSPIDISATGCPNSGIEVIGPNLMLGCNGNGNLVQISQTGTVQQLFETAALRTEDLECDRSTFAAADTPISVMWSKDAFEARFLSFEVPLGSCGFCRAAERRDLNGMTDAERDSLAALERQYLTSDSASGATRGAVVATHRVALNSWHSRPQFFPGHRGYISEFEMWLTDQGHSEFVPLPRWNPGLPVPAQFGGTTGVNGTDTEACTSSFLLNPPVVTGATACTTQPGCNRSATNAVCSGSPTTGATGALPPQYAWDFPGGPVCSGFATIEAVRTALESSWHGTTVHCGVFPLQSTMCDVKVSPSSLIFIFWHAFVDDVAYNYECKCKGSCSVCTDVFTPFNAGPTTSPLAFGDRYSHRHGHNKPPPAPKPNIGYWWWFEDDVIPPDLSPRVVVEHSPFHARGTVRGHANLMPGMVGQALDLDGKNDGVVAEDRSVGDVGIQNFTVDAWIKTSGSGIQPIVSKGGDDDDDHRGGHNPDEGYALFLDDGELALFLGTNRRQSVFVTSGQSITDGNWHHVAAIVDREYAERSRLMVDGVVALQFDATPLDDDATTRARLRIGELDVGRSSHHMRKHHKHHHHDHIARFKGQIDELAMVRSALPFDQVASLFVAGSAGRFGSMGNLPTSAGQPACITQLAQQIAALPPAAAAPLNALYAQLLAAIAAGNIGQARALARQIAQQADAGFDGSYLTVEFHAVANVAENCLTVPPLRR